SQRTRSRASPSWTRRRLTRGPEFASEDWSNLSGPMPPGHLRARRGSQKRIRDHGIRSTRKGPKGLPPPTTEKAKMKKHKFPPGWDEKRVREVIAHYENQSEDEEFAEIESALQEQNVTMMAV